MIPNFSVQSIPMDKCVALVTEYCRQSRYYHVWFFILGLIAHSIIPMISKIESLTPRQKTLAILTCKITHFSSLVLGLVWVLLEVKGVIKVF